MPLLESVLSNLKLSQPFRSFLNELLLLLPIVPGRATFRNLSRYSAYVSTIKDFLLDKSSKIKLSLEGRTVCSGEAR
jgi:hypothetical protein